MRTTKPTLVGAMIVLALSCTDFTHRDRPAAPPEVTGSTAELDEVPDSRNSPEVLVVPIGTPHPVTGGASVSMNVAYKFPTYVSAVASGSVTKTIQYPAKSWYYNNPSGSVTYPANEITLSRYDATMNYRTVEFLASLQKTFLMEGGYSAILGAGRPPHGNGSYFGDCNAFTSDCLPRVYCGIEYGTNCFTYTGGPSMVTLTRLSADMTVTPQTPTALPGDTPYVDYRASPMTLMVNGASVGTPFVPDSTHWIPDADSAGGDAAELPTHAANTGACQPIGTGCRRRIIGSGTFVMNAFVNGKRITKSAHISAPDLLVGVSATDITYGDSVTFTPAWTDGTPITGGVVWTWLPDTPGVTLTPPCGNVTICRVPVREKGRMKIALSRGGVVRTAFSDRITTRMTVEAKCFAAADSTKTSVERGQLVTCRVRQLQGAAMTLKVSADADSMGTLTPINGSLNGSGTVWETTGPGAISTTLNVSWSASGGYSGDASAAFAVAPRTQFADPQVALPGPHELSEPLDRDFTPHATYRVTPTGQFSLVYLIAAFEFFPDIPSAAAAVIPITSGPNQGLSYMGEGFRMTSRVVMNRDLFGNSTDPHTSWKADQNGTDGTSTTRADGVRYCNQSDIPNIIADAQRHEGIGGNPQSHLSVTNKALRDNGVGIFLEVAVFRSPQADLQARRVARDTYRLSQIVSRLPNRQFDAAEYPTNTARWGCAADNVKETP